MPAHLRTPALLVSLLILTACSAEDRNVSVVEKDASAGSGGTAAGGGTSGAGGVDASAGSGGSAAGSGSGGVAGGSGGSGGVDPTANDGSLPTLANSKFDSLITLNAGVGTKLKCGIIRVHNATEDISPAPRWGRHGGPLSFDSPTPGLQLQVRRWQIPVDPLANISPATTTVTPTGLLGSTRFWSDFVDLPFGGLSVTGYTQQGDTQGEVLVLDAAGKVQARAFAIGFFAAMGVSGGSAQRVVYQGLSAVSTSQGGSETTGLYGIDWCNGFFGSGCTAPGGLTSWGGYNGPITSDGLGNVFVEKFSYKGFGGFDEQIVAYGAAQLLGPLGSFNTLGAGTQIYSDTHGTSSLAAIAPGTPGAGLLFAAKPIGNPGVFARSYDASLKTFNAEGTLATPASTDLSLDVIGETSGSSNGRYFWIAVMPSYAADAGVKTHAFLKLRCDP